MELVLNADEINDYLAEVFPQIDGQFTVTSATLDCLTMQMHIDDRHLRPGGTISGPSMFSLADVTVYAMVLARLGRKALAVTTNASLDFLRKPDGGADLVATGRMLKMGRTLVVADLLITSVGNDAPVARASMTYSLPPSHVSHQIT
jgi:uncharacterized protein (TIGR00369 family)